jgi:hypothetical protein
VVSKAIIESGSADLKSYGVMMSGSPRSETHAHGIFSFAEINQSEIKERFGRLVEAVLLAR